MSAFNAETEADKLTALSRRGNQAALHTRRDNLTPDQREQVAQVLITRITDSTIDEIFRGQR